MRHVAPESELVVIGGPLADPESFDLVSDKLDPEDFFDGAHREVWRAFQALSGAGVEITTATVMAHLRDARTLDEVSGLATLNKAWEAAPTAMTIEHHAGIVRDKATLRRIAGLSREIADLIDAPDMTAASAIEEVETRVSGIAENRSTGKMSPLKDFLWPALARIENAEHGIPSGLQSLDSITQGWFRQTLNIVAARPSMGKSALVTGFALQAAKAHTPVAIFSVEMGPLELADRCYAWDAAVDIRHLRRLGRVKEVTDSMAEDFARLSESSARLSIAPIEVDCDSRTVAEMRAKARRMKRTRGLGLIVVDHIHEMHGPGDNREQEVNRIAKDLKALAKELDVPVIAAAQLHRGVEGRESKRPVLSDLRASGGVEEAADLVMMLYRQEYYEPDNDKVKGEAEIGIVKHRNGPTGSVRVHFNGIYGRFTDYTDRQEPGRWAA